uniref:Uncharacterized protein n=1 Tax=Cannabis sativa TaxID=3483 RepID=A0A803QLM5_CANSA
MEDNETQIAIRNTTHQKPQMGNATINNSLSHLGQRSRIRRKSTEFLNRENVKRRRNTGSGSTSTSYKLFDETAGYIMALQCQLKTMRTLAAFVEGLEKSKFGG